MHKKIILNPMFQDEMLKALAIRKAEHLNGQGEYKQVIELLTPFYSKESGEYTPIVELLAIAYLREGENKKMAFSLWNIVFQHTKDTDQQSAIQVLSNLMMCADDQKVKEGLTQKALAMIHVALQKKNCNEKELNKLHHILCNNAGVYNKRMGEKELNADLKKAFDQKAMRYFQEALQVKPYDLRCLLYLSSMTVIDKQSPGLGLKILEPHANLFRKNPNYNFAMYTLYSLTGNNQQLAEHHRALYDNAKGVGLKDEFINLFNGFSGSSRPVNNPILEKMRRAINHYTQQEYQEAKILLHEILIEEPHFLNALELFLKIEESQENIPEIMRLSDLILKINPESLVGLMGRATSFWNLGPSFRKQAIVYCETAFQFGYRNEVQLEMLVEVNDAVKDYQKVLTYASALVDVRPSADMYYLIATTRTRFSQYPEAINAFRQTRLFDKEYKQDEVSIGIIFSLHQLAFVDEQYRKLCVRKLGSYLSRQGDRPRDPVIEMIVQEFEAVHIHFPNAAKAQHLHDGK